MKRNKSTRGAADWLCLSPPAVCRLLLSTVIAGCRAMSSDSDCCSTTRWNLSRSTLTSKQESRQQICQLPLSNTSQANLDLLSSEDYFSKLSKSWAVFETFFISSKNSPWKKRERWKRIHPVQFEFVAGQLGSGLQAVAVHLVFGHEHGDGAALQEHFHITLLWKKQQKGSVR